MGSSSPQTVQQSRGSGTRTVFAIVFILFGALMAPVALVSAQARVQVTDTETFVETFAPLASNPDVKRFVTDQTVEAIENVIDIPGVTTRALDNIAPGATGPLVTRARNRVQAMLAAGIRGLIHDTVSQFVNSDLFIRAWSNAVRASHGQVVATLQGDSNAAVTLGRDGSVSVQLGPIIQSISRLLVTRGLSFAQNIPVTQRSVTLVHTSSMQNLVIGYGLVVLAGTWLPWLSLGALVVGVLLAIRRSRALMWATVALAASMTFLLAGFGVGRVFFLASVAPGVLPMGVATAVWSAITDRMVQTAGVIVILALAAAIVSWFFSSFTYALRVRSAIDAGMTALRTAGARAGVTTGRFGEVLYRIRVPIRVAVGAVIVILVLALRPLTPVGTIWIVLGALCILLLGELMAHPRRHDGLAEATSESLPEER